MVETVEEVLASPGAQLFLKGDLSESEKVLANEGRTKLIGFIQQEDANLNPTVLSYLHKAPHQASQEYIQGGPEQREVISRLAIAGYSPGTFRDDFSRSFAIRSEESYSEER